MKALNNEIRHSSGSLNITLNSNGRPSFGTGGGRFKWQRKYLTAAAPYSLGGTILQFNNLEVGKTYRLTGKMSVYLGDGSTYAFLFLRYMHGSTRLHTSLFAGRTEPTGQQKNYTDSIDFIFTATTTTIAVQYGNRTAGVEIVDHNVGDGGLNNSTYLQLEELPLYEQTTDWT